MFVLEDRDVEISLVQYPVDRFCIELLHLYFRSRCCESRSGYVGAKSENLHSLHSVRTKWLLTTQLSWMLFKVVAVSSGYSESTVSHLRLPDTVMKRFSWSKPFPGEDVIP